MGNGDPMQSINYFIHCALHMRTERWKSKRDEEGRNIERRMEDTNEMRGVPMGLLCFNIKITHKIHSKFVSKYKHLKNIE